MDRDIPCSYALDLRKLNFLQKLSAHHTSVMNLPLPSQPKLVLIYWPRRDRRPSWH